MRSTAGQAGPLLLTSSVLFIGGAGLLWRAALGGAPAGGPQAWPAEPGSAALPDPVEFRVASAAGDALGGGATPVAAGSSLQAPAGGAAEGSAGAAAAAYHDLSGVLAGLGREADRIREELVHEGLKHLGDLGARLGPAIQEAKPPLECLAKDIAEDLEGARKVPAPEYLDMIPSLLKIQKEVGGPEGILERLRHAERDLAGADCLLALSGATLQGTETGALACHRRLAASLAALRILGRELVDLPGVVESEWTRLKPILQGIAGDRYNPDRLKAAALLSYFDPKIRRYRDHALEARWAMAAEPPAKEPAAELARKARTRRDQLERAMDGFYPAWLRLEPIAPAWQRARDGVLALDLSAQLWSKGGATTRLEEVEGSRYAFEAFLAVMDALRLLHQAQDRQT